MRYRWLFLLGAIACGCTCGAPVGGNGDASRDGASEAGLDADLDARIDGNEVSPREDSSADADVVDVADGSCDPSRPCPPGQLCLEGRCVSDLGPCTSNNDCQNDSRCLPGMNRCVPYAPGENDTMCTREVRPGVFAPAVQCRFSDPPPGDPFPQHMHVLSTPMVADLKVYRDNPSDPPRPSLVVVFDDGVDGRSENPTGLIRILDGRTCTLQDNLSEQMVSHSSPPAIGDLDGDGIPEIVAFKAGGGLVAFRYERSSDPDAGRRGAWRVWWRSTSSDGRMPFNPTGGGWAGPTIADIDDDGRPEVLRHGLVFNGQTGAVVGGNALFTRLQSYSAGAFTVVQDVDEDGLAEAITGTGVFAWNPMTRDWTPESYYSRSGCSGPGCGEGHVAVADLGDYTTPRFPDPGTPEIAVVSAGYVRIDTITGHTVFGPVPLPGGGTGGPPTVADFDGDGLREIAAAGARAYSVFDPDCWPVPSRRGGRCGTGTTNGVLWSQPSQDVSSNVTGSTSFDFEADGRVEAVYADECFARVYDGATGTVLFSQHHSSCTWYENPVVADVDGDFRAEIVVGSNFNCGSDTTGIACPGVGPRNTDTLFAGIRCATASDCPSGMCSEGFCRCTTDAQCCPGTGECTYVCTAPPPGTPGTGNTCRASRPVGVRGVRVYRDVADRWVRSRMIWNQHAYNVTNVEDDGRIPATGAVRPNWRDRSLNNFRTNVQGTALTTASNDATVRGGRVDCTDSGARLVALACNRGTAPLPDGTLVGFYNGDPDMGGLRICSVPTPRPLEPGQCIELTCDWRDVPTRTPTTVHLRIDDDRSSTECHEGNNLGTLTNVICRTPG